MGYTLNEEQKAVVNEFKNNIILYASAGTGKTFTVANRVRKILQSGLAKPEEILCLTFTIKACQEMQEDIARYTLQPINALQPIGVSQLACTSQLTDVSHSDNIPQQPNTIQSTNAFQVGNASQATDVSRSVDSFSLKGNANASPFTHTYPSNNSPDVIDTEGIQIKTIHSFCLSVIEEQSKLSGSEYMAPTVFDDVDQDELLSRFVPEELTKWRLNDFLKQKGIADDISFLYRQDVCYTKPLGLCWRFDYKGEKVLLNSRLKSAYERNMQGFITPTPQEKLLCPDCGMRQATVQNFCPACGYDFRTYLQPEVFKLKNFRNVISAIKRFRTIYNQFTGDDVQDYQKTFLHLKAYGGKKFESLVSTKAGVDETFVEKFTPYAGRMVHAYNRELLKSNKVDFDDLVIGALQLLKNPTVYARWKNRFKYIIVDEMQDTSTLEYSVLKRIFADNNVMMCGDIFQTIYEWRGSEPFVILQNYIDEFHAKAYMFSENYRSTKLLTQAGFGYLRNTYPDQIGKYCPSEIKIYSRSDGEKIEYHKLASAVEEAQFVYSYLANHPVADPSQVCIMSRTNAYIAKLYKYLTLISQKQPPEKRLKFFTVDEDYRFYKKPIIKDYLAFWSLLIHTADYAAMERISWRYLRGIGNATLDSIRQNNAIGLSVASFLEADTYAHGDPFYTLIEQSQKQNIVVYDIETTGLDTTQDEVIQIAAIRTDSHGTILKKFNQMVMPKRDISPGALQTHGFSKEYIKEHGGICAKEALTLFADFCKGAVLVGHNSTMFDRAVVNRQFREEGLAPLSVLGEYDTLAISKLVCPDAANYKLETLCNLFGIVNARAHDAFFDVTATAEVLACLIQNYLIPTQEKRKAIVTKFEKRFEEFYTHYTHMRSLFADSDFEEVNRYIAKNFPLKGLFKTDTDDLAVSDLMEAVKEQLPNYPSAEACLNNFLNEAALSGSQMDILIHKLNKIPIVTVHQSKGCEFETVILVGVDDNNFPSYAAAMSGNESEEKRVFYVAISRAKAKLIMTYHESAVTPYGSVFLRHPSPYVKNIPEECIEYYK
jgi:DNA helicase-2/ATP-dependent DNA helicase PcrA